MQLVDNDTVRSDISCYLVRLIKDRVPVHRKADGAVRYIQNLSMAHP